MAGDHYILIVKCPDTKGIVAAVASYLADNDCSIVESNHFNDAFANMFYMRTVFRQDGARMPPLALLQEGFRNLAHRFDMEWQFHNAAIKPRVMIAVSKFGHCLFDLLHRWRSGLLPVDITAVVSNHDDMRSFVEWSGIPYHHFPVTGDAAAQERKILHLAEEQKIELVVLARYMQILSPEACAKLAGRCINIHHSFLPSFKGARPYHQAYERGVKIIGATAHYVTTDLDDGPIIEQGVARVDHADAPEDLISIGRDIECSVLARVVRWHIERRVILNGRKTVVFN
jgi:formyltetrahydrofolate deformylase